MYNRMKEAKMQNNKRGMYAPTKGKGANRYRQKKILYFRECESTISVEFKNSN